MGLFYRIDSGKAEMAQRVTCLETTAGSSKKIHSACVLWSQEDRSQSED